MALFPGYSLKMGDETFVVPALSLGQLRNGALAKLKEHDEIIAAGRTFEAMQIRGEIILTALRRNYPDFDEVKLFDHLDLKNTGNVWLAVLGASGFLPGEERAETPTTASGTSAQSTEA